MISAEQAAQESEKALNKILENELSKIEEGIRKEIQRGSRCYSYDGCITPAVKAKLKNEGYKVTTGSQYNNEYVIIDW